MYGVLPNMDANIFTKVHVLALVNAVIIILQQPLPNTLYDMV